ncbi:hypothetical protein PACTADRAFT_73702 [Pachysolen tannophilus NRRL Y-2460]|uniref:DNA mismatch repair protein HSM3 n=1 Tax=Pachysolen tannophilus NRRL Y-2460 TaxID=669874 RepID=A0A1E4U247_PACTA|nr:hypothetical protein PACTADRAFT_73702 [Pachysolen tannophilus NRRL Y-2460]
MDAEELSLQIIKATRDDCVDVRDVEKLFGKLLSGADIENRLELVQSLIKYLATGSSFFELDDSSQNSVIKLLSLLLDKYSIDYILQNFYSLNDLINFINLTKNNNVFKLISNLLLKISPIDILSNTELIKILITKLNDVELSLGIINSIEDFIMNLALVNNSELMKRRLLSHEIINLLMSMRNSGKDKQIVRLLDLISNVYLNFVKDGDIPTYLYSFEFKDFIQDDVMLVVCIIDFHNRVLSKIIEDNNRLCWLSDKLVNQYEYIVRLLFDQNLADHDNKSFIINEVTIFTTQLSYLPEGKYFDNLNGKYHIIDRAIDDYTYNDESISLLSKINPNYLMNKQQFLKDFAIYKVKFIPILNNLIQKESIFEIVKLKNFNTSSLKNLPSLKELFGVLVVMSSFKWSTFHLLNHLPSIMNTLLDNAFDIVEPEVFELKKQILANLIFSNTIEELGIWNSKIRETYSLMLDGKPLKDKDVQVAVYDQFS